VLRPWSAAIRRLKLRATWAGAIDELGRLAIPAAVLAILYFGLSRMSPWMRFFAPFVGALIAIMLLGAIVVGALRARRSEIYFAKWIDLESNLSDRLASAVEWSYLAELDRFQLRCVEQLILALNGGQLKLMIPRPRSSRQSLTFAACLVLGAVGVIYWRQPAPSLERDARQKIKLAQPVLELAAKGTEAIKTSTDALHDEELAQMTTDLTSLVRDMDRGVLDRESSLGKFEQLRRQLASSQRKLAALRDLPSRIGGRVGRLAQALVSGNPTELKRATAELEAALGAGAVSDEELAQLEPVLAAMAALASEARDDELTGQLRDAARAARQGNGSAAAQALARAGDRLGAINRSLMMFATTRQISQMLDVLERGVREGTTASAQAAAGDANRAPGDRGGPRSPAGAGSSPGTLSAGSGGIAAGEGPGEHNPGTPPTEGAAGEDLKIQGTWNGAVVRQLFQAPGTTGASDEARRLLAEHERVAEDRFRHDDVPMEYQDAVRAYFAALHERGGQWTQTRK
jgi:hypothetical protein